MTLKTFIHALIDTLDDLGDLDLYLTTENETECYPSAIVHYIPGEKTGGNDVLRIEAISYETEENLELGDEEYFE